MMNGSLRRSKQLCADAGYRERGALKIVASHGLPHAVGRRNEADAKRRKLTKKARCCLVEVCHSWLNRFHKLLVRCEKLHRSCIALSHIGTPMMALREVPPTMNITCGWILG